MIPRRMCASIVNSLILLTCLCVCSTPLLAQCTWTSLHGPYDAGKINDIIVTSSSDYVYAATDSGLYKYIQKDSSWEKLSAPSVQFASLLIDEDHILAGSSQDGLFMSPDDGKTWGLLAGFPERQILALTRDAQGWLYAGSDDVYLSTDRGETWTSLNACWYPDFPVMGLNFGPYLNGASPGQGVSKNTIDRLLDVIVPYTKWIRTFGCDDGLEHVGRLAHDKGLKTAIGAWIDSNDVVNKSQADALIALANAGDVDIAVVGCETQFRYSNNWGGCSEDSLIYWIEYVRNGIQDSSVVITTAETDYMLKTHPNVIKAVDVVFANVYPFHNGIVIDSAVSYIHKMYVLLQQEVESVSPGKEIWISETGWPTNGEANASSIPNLSNAIKYLHGIATWSRAEKIPVFLFAAFDEDWKAAVSGNEYDKYWGMWNDSLEMKSGMDVLFSGEMTGSDWTSDTTICGGPGTPSITFTHVPGCGAVADAYLEGKVWHVDATQYKIAVCIRASGVWWNKPWSPEYDMPISIDEHCAFRCNVRTMVSPYGSDECATAYMAFVIPIDMVPSKCDASTIPQEMFDNCIAWTVFEDDSSCGIFRSLLVKSSLLLAGSANQGLFTLKQPYSENNWQHPMGTERYPVGSNGLHCVNSIVSYKNTNSAIYAGGYLRVFESADGISWGGYSDGLMNNGILDLTMPSDNNVFAGTGSGVQYIEQGSAWCDCKLDRTVRSLTSDDLGYVYAGKDSGGVWKKDFPVEIEIPDLASYDVTPMLDPIYPNPSQRNMHISVHADSPLYTRISVCNMLGQELMEIYSGRLDETITHFAWDTGVLPAGQYLCKMSTKDRIEVQPFVVVR